MGKKASWFSVVKKVLSHETKEKKDQKTNKSKKIWFRKHKSLDVISFLEQSPLDDLAPLPTVEDLGGTKEENEQDKHACSVVAEVAAAQPAVEVVQQPSIFCSSGKSKEEIAAIMIQTAFRRHTARRALRALKALVRLKSLVQGQSVKQQVASTLKCLQTISRVQSEIRARRIRVSEENHALQRQLQQKREREIEKIEEQWDDSTHSKAQLEAKFLKRQEAASRRERALAYAFSRQQTWKNSSKTATSTFMDPNNPYWGWSWLERWMAVRPWEARNTGDYQDHVSIPSAENRASVVDTTKVHASPRTPYQKSSQPHNRRSFSTSKASSSSGRQKIKPASLEDDSRSKLSVKSERYRRHSFAGSSASDYESIESLPSVSSHLTPKKPEQPRSRLSNPSKAATESPHSSGTKKQWTTEKGLAGSAKKRLSFTASPARSRPRRHSSPPSVVAS